MWSRHEGCLQKWSVFPRAPSKQQLLGSQVNNCVEDQVDQLGTAAGNQAWRGIEKSKMQICHRHNNCKIWCTKYKTLCLLGKHNPVPFPTEDSESYWIAQKMLVGALVETQKPVFGQVAFKILALIHCCAHCRTSNSMGKCGCGILGSSVFWELLGSHFVHNTG